MLLTEIIATEKARYEQDYKGDHDIDSELMAFEEGMITAFRLMFEQSLRGSISFDLMNSTQVNFSTN